LGDLTTDLANEVQDRESLADTVIAQGNELIDQALSITELQGSVGILEEQVAEGTETISGIQTDISDLNDAISEIEAGAGQDRLLRAEFENFKTVVNTKQEATDSTLATTSTRLDGLDSTITGFDSSINELTTSLSSHARNKENPHQVTAKQLDLDNVDNTRDLDKPISTATQAALNERVKTSDIVNTLTSLDATKPLSAQQGSKLVGLIQDAQSDMVTRITALGNVFHFKGTVPSIADLQKVVNPEVGDCWQINNPEDDKDPDNGSMFAYKETIQIPKPEPDPEEEEEEIPENPEEPVVDPEPEVNPEEESEEEPEMIDFLVWVQIVASAIDISAYAASMDEIYHIIDSY